MARSPSGAIAVDGAINVDGATFGNDAAAISGDGGIVGEDATAAVSALVGAGAFARLKAETAAGLAAAEAFVGQGIGGDWPTLLFADAMSSGKSAGTARVNLLGYDHYLLRSQP